MPDLKDRIRLGMRVNRLSNHLRTAMDQQFMRNDGLTAQQTRTILFLYRTTCEENRAVSQRDLERFLGLKSPTVTGVLKRLEEGGMIKRTVSKTDGRVKTLWLTPRGMSVHANLKNEFDFFEQVLLEGFCPQEAQQLIEYLDRLEENVRQLSGRQSH
jgi:MarR family transcriptional repressor of mepA